MLENSTIITAVIVIVFIVLAFLKKITKVERGSFILIQLLIIWREFSINSHARNLIWENRTLVCYTDGVRAIQDYCIETNLILLIGVLVSTILYFKKKVSK